MSYELTCSAPDCEKPFKSIMPHAKYCSDRCRWRDKKREQKEKRIKEGLCPQCGGEMILPFATNKKRPSYCKECQRNFQRLYFEKKGAGWD